MKAMKNIIFTLLLIVSISAAVSGQEDAANPCGMKAMGATDASNPCSHKEGMMFYIDDPMNRNSVTFKSTAPLEDIVGTTNQITGYIVFDPKKPKIDGHGEFSVPVASLNSGIPLRDEHIRSADWLDAGKYPDIKLTIKKIKKVKEVSNSGDAKTYDVTLMGNLSFHGNTEQIEVNGRISYLKESETTRQRMPGNLLAVRAEFSVPLAEFKVTGPAGMGLVGSKVGEAIDIEVSLMATSNAPAMAKVGNPCGEKAAMNPYGGKAGNVGNPCNPCGAKK